MRLRCALIDTEYEVMANNADPDVVAKSKT